MFKVRKCQQFRIVNIKVSLNVSVIVYIRIKRFWIVYMTHKSIKSNECMNSDSVETERQKIITHGAYVV